MFQKLVFSSSVEHIMDAMGVCMTLIHGEHESILFDTGYGLENVRTYIDGIAPGKRIVVLSHGHHDHILGSQWFDEVFLHPDDAEEYHLRTGAEQRKKVWNQAIAKGLNIHKSFLRNDCPTPEPLPMEASFGKFQAHKMCLEDMQVWLIHVPGHTPGSLMGYVPEQKLLLTGDNWNPCTWLWFPSSLAVQQWKKNMTDLLHEIEEYSGVSKVLCSHQHRVFSAEELYAYLDWISEDAVHKADEIVMDQHIHTKQLVLPEKGWTLVFDADKYERQEVLG